MKPIYTQFVGAIAITFAVAACIPATTSPPPAGTRPAPAQTRPAPVEAAPATLPAAQASQNWLDQPRTPGDWGYRPIQGGTLAEYSDASGPLFSIGCTAPARQIVLRRENVDRGSDVRMTVRTETSDRTLVARPTDDGPANRAVIAANDSLLDAVALTRGRFAVEVAGTDTLYLPAWAEVTRVIEDCR